MFPTFYGDRDNFLDDVSSFIQTRYIKNMKVLINAMQKKH